MIENPYLIAIALIEQNGKRAMPLGGKALHKKINKEVSIYEAGEKIALELLVRVFQRTDLGALNRAAHDKSFLLLHLGMEEMQMKIPSIKSEWIELGQSEKLISKLKAISHDVWTITYQRYEGIQIQSIDSLDR